MSAPEPAEIRHLPVPVETVEARPIERPALAALPAPIVAATGGFLAGVATFVLLRVLRRPRRAALRLPGRKRANRLEIAGSRSFLVDVHVLKR
ncbi:MAG: hypothetical protein ACJ77M_15845 [Thermoleophilaceae bacterium]|jgi:hypothetical protein